MLLRIEKLQDVCKDILTAVDSNELAIITETLEMKVEDHFLVISVTNREYFTKVKIDIGDTADFHATVNAEVFLRLISRLTTDTVDMKVEENNLIIKANGNYKLPLIYDQEELLKLPEITIGNITNEFEVDSEILKSILYYNSKELTNKGAIANPVQKLYYLDQEGCITFTSGACVNSFTLPQPIKILLNNKLVKLFKLFEGKVKIKIGFDVIGDNLTQLKICLYTDSIEITAALPSDESLINAVPASIIRGMANGEFAYSVNINKNWLGEAIDRLMLFDDKDTIKHYARFVFGTSSVDIYSVNGENKESVDYNNNCNIDGSYETILDFKDLKNTLDTCNEEYINISFGNNQSIVIQRGNIRNIIPECNA